MQPAPPEVPQNATQVDTLSDTLDPYPQHGFSSTNEPASDGLSPIENSRRCQSRESTDVSYEVSGSSDRGRRMNTRDSSRSTSSSQETSPGSRIEAYEKSSATPRKLSDGIIFQIVPNANGRQSAISVLDFPNEVLTHILSHLPPETLSSMSLVCRRFHKLVTTPPAWRIAFARYFPGYDPVSQSARAPISPELDVSRTERRNFTRLSALASWRSEYILRTRLLRSLARGRPAVQASHKSSSRHANTPAAAVVTYGSALLYPVSHIHATFGVGLNKKQPLFVHGASEQGAVSTSDPSVAKIGGWGLGDFEAFKHFADLFVGEVEYGLGSGDFVGMPNVMDLSQPYGKLYGEACPGGRLFFTSTVEHRGRFLPTTSTADHDAGIPNVTMVGCSVTSVWIAKSDAVLKVTNGLFGCLAGFSNGIVAAYALGVNPVHDRRFAHGEPTAKWVFCPGVPIIAIAVDDKVNAHRIGNRRVWATVLNALGEVYYLTDVPLRPDFKGRLSEHEMDHLAWQTGRSVAWQLIESTRRSAKPDPFNTSEVDGSYSPQSSSHSQGLSKEQISAETKEIERFLVQKPKHFRNLCDGWDMRRKLIVDYTSGDRGRGGESFFIINCGFSEDNPPSIRRVTRQLTKTAKDFTLEPFPPITSSVKRASVFGNSAPIALDLPSPSPLSTPRSRTSSHDNFEDSAIQTEWRISNFTMGHLRNFQISTVASDNSDFATITTTEDPLLSMVGSSNTSSPVASPLGRLAAHASSAEIPGRRARYMAVGTSTGMVILWNMRSSMSPALDVINSVQPTRYIYTKSPQISSLALTALYVVHGGNDGLVQAWDPLASSTEPIRTLNSRFSDRARRRIAQAESSIHGVGNNYYAAGSIILDPDPTTLRGMVSLGTHLRYWSYSAATADAYKSRKRGQLRRRSERGSNTGTTEQKFHHTGRSVLKDYIQNEKQELENEKIARRKERERMTGRFGTNILGDDASEEEMLAYATMLSEESFAKDAERSTNAIATDSSSAEMPLPGSTAVDVQPEDTDLEEAIRLSLLDSEIAAESPQTTEYDVTVTFAKDGRRGASTKHGSKHALQSISYHEEDDDLDFALRLSLAEQASRGLSEEDFPALSPGSGSDTTWKGKGRSKNG